MSKSTEVFSIIYGSRISSKTKATILVAQGVTWNGIVLEVPQKEDTSPKAEKVREILGSALILNKGLNQFKNAFECVESGKSTSVFLTVEVTHTGEVNEYGKVTNVNLVADNTEVLMQSQKAEAENSLKKMMNAAPKKVSNFSLADFLDEEEEIEEEVVSQIAEPKKATAKA